MSESRSVSAAACAHRKAFPVRVSESLFVRRRTNKVFLRRPWSDGEEKHSIQDSPSDLFISRSDRSDGEEKHSPSDLFISRSDRSDGEEKHSPSDLFISWSDRSDRSDGEKTTPRPTFFY